MTTNQKYILQKLFEGSFITSHNSRYRLIDKQRNPQRAFTTKTYNGIAKLLRKQKGVQIINLTAVRQQNGNTWVKQFYKASKK